MEVIYMDLSEIISDAFKYPFSDYKKFLMLGLPYLAIGIITLILGLQVAGTSEITNSTMNSSAMESTFIISLLLFYIVAIVAQLIMSGIGISVTRETINLSNNLPEIDLKNNIVDGLKSFVVTLIYIGIPILIFTIVLAVLLVSEAPDILIGIIVIVLFVAMVFLLILEFVALGRLAETGSIGKSLNLSYIFEMSKTIGLGKIFITNLICIILLAIIGIVGSLLEIIPVVGFVLVMYIVYTYNILVTSRVCGLLYRERNGVSNYNNMYQQPANNVDYNEQQYNQTPEVVQNSPVGDFNSANNSPYDFHPDNNNEANNSSTVEEDISEEMKICSKCGYTNPDFVNICVNCGNKL